MDSMDPHKLRFLESAGIPLDDEVVAEIADVQTEDLWRYGERLLNPSAARNLFQEWNPGDMRWQNQTFLHAFRERLIDAFRLGIRLDRLRSIQFPDPDSTAEWQEAFEASIVDENIGQVRLLLCPDLMRAVESSNRQLQSGRWEDLLEQLSDEVFADLGLVYPPPRIEVDDSLSAPWFRCEWNDHALPPQRGLEEHQILVEDTPDRLKLFGLDGIPIIHPRTGSESSIINSSDARTAEEAGLPTWDRNQYLGLSLSATIRNRAAGFVSRTLYELYSQRLREFRPDLIDCLEGRFRVTFIVHVLRALLVEGISIKNLPEIFEELLMLRSVNDADLSRYIVFAPPTRGVLTDSHISSVSAVSPEMCADFVRSGLKRQISHLYTHGQNTLVVYLLDPAIEQMFHSDLSTEEHEKFLAAVRDELAYLPQTERTSVILTTLEIRRRVWRAIHPEFPHTVVVSYNELSPDLNIQPIARISLD